MAMAAIASLAVAAWHCTETPAKASQRSNPTSSTVAPTASAAAGTRTYVIFADVTESLSPEEEQSVYETVRDVVAVIPNGSQLWVFPIIEDVPRSHAVFHGTLPPIESTADRIYSNRLRQDWVGKIGRQLEGLRRGPKTGRTRTCISGGLRKATELVSAGSLTEVIFASDMLEDCPDSLLGGAVSLEKTDISKEVARARALPADHQLLDLKGANITAVLTTVPVSKPRVKRPPVHRVAEFWRAVLDRCGDRRENFYVGTQLPSRLVDLADQSSP